MQIKWSENELKINSKFSDKKQRMFIDISSLLIETYCL